MGGCRCSYRTCTNTTKTRENLHFFHYPVKQKERCKRWIEAAQKPQFYNLEEDQLRNKVVCETHFKDSNFPNPQKKRLLQGAIPTLDGDCVQEPPKGEIKMQDVQLLPADENGTIFVLETGTKSGLHSEKVESYIYTNNGLVLPISKSEPSDVQEDVELYDFSLPSHIELDTMHSEQSLRQSEQTLRQSEPSFKQSEPHLKHTDPLSTVEQIQNPLKKKARVLQAKTVKITPGVVHVEKQPAVQKQTQQLDKKYITKIKQHSKDIALLKNLLKANRPSSNASILHTLKKRLPPSLYSLVQLHFPKPTVGQKHWECFREMQERSPQVYTMLREKYQWKLPHSDSFNQH